MNPTILAIISLLAPIIIGVIQVPIYDEIQKVLSFLKTLPAWLTQLLVVLLSFGANQLFSLTGIQIPTTTTGFTSASIGAVLSATLAFILKNAQNVSATKALTVINTNAIANNHADAMTAIADVKVPDMVVNTSPTSTKK